MPSFQAKQERSAGKRSQSGRSQDGEPSQRTGARSIASSGHTGMCALDFQTQQDAKPESPPAKLRAGRETITARRGIPRGQNSVTRSMSHFLSLVPVARAEHWSEPGQPEGVPPGTAALRPRGEGTPLGRTPQRGVRRENAKHCFAPPNAGLLAAQPAARAGQSLSSATRAPGEWFWALLPKQK